MRIITISNLRYQITKWGLFLGPIILLFVLFYYGIQVPLAGAIFLTVMGCLALSLALFGVMWWKSRKVIEMAQKRYKDDIMDAGIELNEIVDTTSRKIKKKFGGK